MKTKIHVNRRALNDQRLQQAMARRRLIEARRRALLDLELKRALRHDAGNSD
ncbi:MAG: hypothetical protein KDJ54_07125 [Candidatus Competibacteraceae bacterium]|nr:hypothetical protein [Candidatus Competibacteraceae bacterium]